MGVRVFAVPCPPSQPFLEHQHSCSEGKLLITWQMQWGLWSMDLSLSGERQGQVGGSKTASIVADLSETTFETLYGEERCVWLGHRGGPCSSWQPPLAAGDTRRVSAP